MIILNAAIMAFLLWASVISAHSSGLVCNWKPFFVDQGLLLSTYADKFLPEKIPSLKKEAIHLDNLEYPKPDEPANANKKNALGGFKVSLSGVNSFMMTSGDVGSITKAPAMSRLAKTLPAFFQNPSADRALQTSKLIELQVNFGFEF